MHHTASNRERALDTVEESIRETLEAQAEYLAAWDAHWRERVASNFATLTERQAQSGPLTTQPSAYSVTAEA